MAELLFRLRNVPEDEAEEIRQLLSENHIDFYETYAGGWGISMPGIWLHDDEQLEKAKSLIDVYQKERASSARSAYEQLVAEGRQNSMLKNILKRPLRFLLLIAALVFILYISLRPFLGFGQ